MMSHRFSVPISSLRWSGSSSLPPRDCGSSGHLPFYLSMIGALLVIILVIALF